MRQALWRVHRSLVGLVRLEGWEDGHQIRLLNSELWHRAREKGKWAPPHLRPLSLSLPLLPLGCRICSSKPKARARRGTGGIVNNNDNSNPLGVRAVWAKGAATRLLVVVVVREVWTPPRRHNNKRRRILGR